VDRPVWHFRCGTRNVTTETVAHLRHQLRTYINHVLGYSDILIEDAGRGQSQFMPALQQIRAGGHQLLGLVQTALGDPQGLLSTSVLDTALSDLHDKVSEVFQGSEKLRDEMRSSQVQKLADVEAITHALRNLLDYTQPSSPRASSPSNEVAECAESAFPEALLAPNREESTIVIGDDDQANRNMLVRHLEVDGYQIVEAKDGTEVLSILSVQQCDLVLLDMIMPELDGFETLGKMKHDPRLRDIPVMMISASDELASIVRCIEMGAEDYLPRPFNPVLLRARIGASLERKRLRDREQAKTEQLKRTLLLLEDAQEQLALQASQDALTGLANRRSVDAHIEYRQSQNTPFSVFYIDLNGFKKINDSYGHQAGDELLKQVGSRLRLVFRSSDVIGRWGGDEFVGLVDARFGTAEEGVVRIAECFREVFVIQAEDKEIRVSVGAAIGIATWKPGDNVAEVIKRADSAMYSRKLEDHR
jgi:diguanylate cyclase (GGDEF)-like protein